MLNAVNKKVVKTVTSTKKTYKKIYTLKNSIIEEIAEMVEYPKSQKRF